MAKKKNKNRLISMVSIVLLLVLLTGIFIMFYAMPNGDNIKANLQKDDYATVADITNSTLLPEGAIRQLTMSKLINFKIYYVTITYFESYEATRKYYNDLELSDGEKAYMRGEAIIRGDEKSAREVRWKIWAF